ncbi:hypothetical protein AKO1_004196 [Acrasis kona]|uniref:Enhancer of rudimentary homolog n=1 Tax=Acrasis kona TaxID=1008807 RepID=A0AAW2ZEP4_9EUKA
MSRGSAPEKHTIILYQLNNVRSRTYFDYPNISASMDGICQLFEAKLKQNSNQKNITYSVNDLYSWVDSLGDITALVYDADTYQYSPKDKEWVKRRLFEHLKRQVSASN